MSTSGDGPLTGIAAAFAGRAIRRDGGREVPAGPKARRTRERIIQAAHDVFLDRGYQRTTMADVAEAAGVSLGAVYQYFRDRGDLVAAIVQAGLQELLTRADVDWRIADGPGALERILTNYAAAFEQAPGVARVWEEACQVDAEMAAVRRRLTHLFQKAVEDELTRAVRAGCLRAGLEPRSAAGALCSMVDRYCYMTYVFDAPDSGGPPAAETGRVLADLWWHSLGLDR
jgi:AcrR family transcriptional regulator